MHSGERIWDWIGEVNIHEPEAQAIEAHWAGPLDAEPLRLASLTVRIEAERKDDGWEVRAVAYGVMGVRDMLPIEPPVVLPERGELALLRGQIEAAARGWSDEAWRIEQLRAAEERHRAKVLAERVREVGAALKEAWS